MTDCPLRRRAAVVRLSGYPGDMLVRREAEAIASLGYDVEVFCLREGAEAKDEIVGNVRVHRLPLQRRKRGIFRNLFEYVAFFFLVAWALTVEHLRRPFAVIQVNTMPDFLVFATLLPKMLGARVTLQMYEPMAELWEAKFQEQAPVPKKHGAFPLRRWAARLPLAILRRIAIWAVAYADHTFTVTEPLKALLVRRGAAPEKITVVLNVPDVRLFGDAPEERRCEPAGFRLICTGAIEERYGHDTMLHAIAALRAELPGLQLRITGDGGWRDAFLALRDSLGLQDCVHYLGYVPLESLVAELQAADAGVVAQKASPYSHLVHTGKMYDYLAFGKPVIASRLDAVRAYFDEDSLCYFTPGDPQDLARAIRELVRCPEHRRALVRNSQKQYARYRWDGQKDHFLSVYRHWAGASEAAALKTG